MKTQRPLVETSKKTVLEFRVLKSVDANDPRCVDPESGEKISAAVDDFVRSTKTSIPQIADKLGIGKENIYAYRRGHQVPTDQTREALERLLGVKSGSLKSSGERRRSVVTPTGETDTTVTKKIVGQYLVVTTTTRIPLSEISAN